MRANKVTGAGIKGRKFSYPLRGVNIITGDNMEGKSAVIDAVKLALLGHIPELGRTPGVTFLLATGTKMAVELELDNGQAVSRAWELQRNSVKASEVNPLEVPPVLLDLGVYFSKTAAEKTKYIFEQVDLDALGFSVEKITAELKRVKVAEPSEHTERALNETIDEANLLAEEVAELGLPKQAWMERLVEKVKEKKKEADATAKRMAQNLTAQAQLQVSEEAEYIPDDIEQQLTAKQTELDAARKVKNSLVERANRCALRAQQRAIIEQQISVLGTVEPWEPLQAEAEKLENELEAEQPEDKQAVAEALSRADEKVRSLTVQLNKITNDINNTKARHAREMESKICPHCGSTGEGWKESLAGKHGAELKEKATELEAVTQEKNSAEKERDSLKETYAELKAKWETFENKRKSLREKSKRVGELAKRANAINKWQAELNAIECENAPTNEEIKAALNTEAELEAEVMAMRQQQKKLVARRQDELRREQAKQELEATKSEAAISKAMLEKLVEVQDKMNETAFQSIIVQARRVTDGILKGQLDYRDGEIGYYRGPQWVCYKTFSGTEKAVAFAAMAVALCRNTPYRVVIIDELGVMKPERRAQLVGRMLELVEAGEIDQFFGADTDASLYQSLAGKELNVIEIKPN